MVISIIMSYECDKSLKSHFSDDNAHTNKIELRNNNNKYERKDSEDVVLHWRFFLV